MRRLAIACLLGCVWLVPGAGASDESVDPVFNPRPASTLLPPGTTSLTISVETTTPTSCRWAASPHASFHDMEPMQGTGTLHTAAVPIEPSPLVVNRFWIRSEAHADSALSLVYRSLPEVDPAFPRVSNLWGAYYFEDRSPEYLARYDLLLGNDFDTSTVLRLRSLRPGILVLTSINATSAGNEAPPSYYLRDVNGERLQVWVEGWQLDLTRPEVAEWNAHRIHERIVAGGLSFDGVFFDNVFLHQSAETTDMYGRPFLVDTNQDGRPDDPVDLARRWREGVLHELATFRELMPHAILTGHALDLEEPMIAATFNGIGIGFATVDVIENRNSWGYSATDFQALRELYDRWNLVPSEPRITQVESAVFHEIAYGYGFTPYDDIPVSTLRFARDFFPYMRFGLAFTLTNDGYFAHEVGDTWHGNDWWYDELDLDLGRPLGPAQELRAGDAASGYVLLRDFEHGRSVLNPTRETVTVSMGSGYRRLEGAQAPRYQLIRDNADVSFEARGAVRVQGYDSGLWTANPPYFHDWGHDCVEVQAGGTALWRLAPPEGDDYSVSVWWPAAPASSSWSRAARFDVIEGGVVLASASFDQSQGGDEWHSVGTIRLAAGSDAAVAAHAEDGRPLLADAVLYESRARYNDGSAAATVTIGPMDGIILRRE